MSFKSYAASPLKDGSLELSDPRPLTFSGAEGLIARFVRKEPARAAEPWKLLPDELHELALPGGNQGVRMIIFEEATLHAREFQWLQSISGISADRTEMMFSFLPMRSEQGTSPLRVRLPELNRIYAEELSLDGGVSAPAGPWRWCKPHLALGGVVLQRRPVPVAPAGLD